MTYDCLARRSRVRARLASNSHTPSRKSSDTVAPDFASASRMLSDSTRILWIRHPIVSQTYNRCRAIDPRPEAAATAREVVVLNLFDADRHEGLRLPAPHTSSRLRPAPSRAIRPLDGLARSVRINRDEENVVGPA